MDETARRLMENHSMSNTRSDARDVIGFSDAIYAIYEEKLKLWVIVQRKTDVLRQQFDGIQHDKHLARY